ncbi:MAG: hypothetical protein WHS88_06475 [Anaerohalosphaeraceae bacterium]
MKARIVWFAIILCMFGLVARAEVVVTTEFGQGADTYLTNDSQQGPTVNVAGEERIRAFRQLANTRSKTGFIRFDLSGIDGDLEGAFITFDATYLKGGEKSVTVYGLIDGPMDIWNESTITYNTAPCMVPNPPTTLGNYQFADGTVVQLGTLTTPSAPADPITYPVAFSSNPTALPLKDFLSKDTNGLVTLIFIGGDNEVEVASKEHATFNPPMLTLPNAYAVRRASNPVPANNVKVTIGQYSTLSWTNPEPNLPEGQITCDVYFGETEPNALLPHYGLTLLASGVTGNSVPMPQLAPYKTYYWVVDTYDTSRTPEYVQGKVWTFNTNNSAPVVNAGPDQFVWLTRTIVDTTSEADTYIRDNVVRGSYEFMDIRGGSVDFVGYLRFNLSELKALGPGTIKNATLTLTVSGGASRNDAVTNARFALQGLNNVAGNTPQNWSEAALTKTGEVIPGAEWDGAAPLTNAIASGRVTDLDDNVAGISEVITPAGGNAANPGTKIAISGAALEAFLQSRLEDNGLVTFIITNDDGNDRGYGLGTKENQNPDYRPRLQLTYLLEGATGSGDAVVTLVGTVTDDGLPSGQITVQWTQVSGPEGAEPVVIDPDDQLETTVTLASAGWYEFQLEASDGELSSTDNVRVYVGIDPCDAAHQVPGYTRLISDLNDDCFVNLKDVAILASQWLNCSSLDCP